MAVLRKIFKYHSECTFFKLHLHSCKYGNAVLTAEGQFTIDNMAFNLCNNLDLHLTTKLKRILPSETGRDTSSHPATSNSLPIDSREHTSRNNTIEAKHDTTSINPDFHTQFKEW